MTCWRSCSFSTVETEGTHSGSDLGTKKSSEYVVGCASKRLSERVILLLGRAASNWVRPWRWAVPTGVGTALASSLPLKTSLERNWKELETKHWRAEVLLYCSLSLVVWCWPLHANDVWNGYWSTLILEIFVVLFLLMWCFFSHLFNGRSFQCTWARDLKPASFVSWVEEPETIVQLLFCFTLGKQMLMTFYKC